MLTILKIAFFVVVFSALCQTAIADTIYSVTVDTAPLVGHPAGPFYIEFGFTDGDGIGDANNTVTLSNFDLGGGSALGGPLVFGGTSGSLETQVTLVDNSFLSLFSEQFAPGFLLSFSLRLTSNEDAGGTPDGFTLFLLDSSGVPIPTLAPFGDYFIGADLGSAVPIFSTYGSDSSRPLSVGHPVSISAPTIDSVNSTPEPSTIYLLGAAITALVVVKSHISRSSAR